MPETCRDLLLILCWPSAQGDHLSGKTGNIREFDSCRRNVNFFTGQWLPCLQYCFVVSVVVIIVAACRVLAALVAIMCVWFHLLSLYNSCPLFCCTNSSHVWSVSCIQLIWSISEPDVTALQVLFSNKQTGHVCLSRLRPHCQIWMLIMQPGRYGSN